MIMAMEHVPAWRKLGLKLKSEENPDPAQVVVPTIETPRVAKKRKLSLPDGIGDQVRAGGALQQTTTKPHTNGVRHDASAAVPRRSSLARSHSPTPDQVTPQTSPRKRKSVSFTPDTKAEDGGTNLKPLNSPRLDAPPSLFDVYMNETQESVEEPTEPNGALEDRNGGKKKVKDQKEKKEKKQKQKQKTTQPAPSEDLSPSSQPTQDQQAPSEDVRPQLRYLDEYYRSRSTWKFNKAKQNWLLNHAFDLDKIPSKYDTALDHYIRGLDSKMARLRLFERAKEIVAADDADAAKQDNGTTSDTTSTVPQKRARSASPNEAENDIYPDEARIADLATALKSVRAQVRAGVLQHEEAQIRRSKEFRKRLFNRARAETILWRVEPHESYFISGAHTPAQPGSVQLAKKPTIMTYDEPSEADETTRSTARGKTNGVSSEGAGEGSTKKTTKGRRRRHRKRRTGMADDDTSSSESSDDSSAEHDGTRRAEEHARALVKNTPLRLGSPVHMKKNEGREEDASSSADEGTSSSGGESSEDDDESENGSEDESEDESGSESE